MGRVTSTRFGSFGSHVQPLEVKPLPLLAHSRIIAYIAFHSSFTGILRLSPCLSARTKVYSTRMKDRLRKSKKLLSFLLVTLLPGTATFAVPTSTATVTAASTPALRINELL